MPKLLTVILNLIVGTGLAFSPIYSHAACRLKDMVEIEGIRENPLIGYSLVVGLNGTGDNLNNSVFTEKSLIDYFNRLGISTTNLANNLNTRNVAAVIVTATLPAFAKPGNKIPIVNVSTIGDAKSLKGGRLLPTTLLGADNEVYAIAQGPLIIGTPSDNSNSEARPGSMAQKAIPTAGYIPNGAIVEKSVNFSLDSLREIHLSLKNPDITTARSIAIAINSNTRSNMAYANDPSTITVKLPNNYYGGVVNLLANLENLMIEPDTSAKIVIDEATGTIIIGEHVTISNIAISQGNLTIKIGPDEALALELQNEGSAAPAPGTQIATLKSNTTLADLVKGLNTLGVRPKQLIAILNMLRQAGALQADIQVY